MKKLKRDDEVIIIAGKDKGKRGKITRVLSDGRLVVSGINMIKRHTKPNPMLGTPGGIVEKEAPIQHSNVAIFNAAKGKADRVGFKVLEDGTKVRVFKSDNEAIDS
ncbi:MAG: 50S ribosomal protein L24 [Pseudomonadales bacterium]|uniref:Large ribosomal subunit protein uL24 n=1 Tax=Oleiphilus messinensis TaxID=141451 RepID=A0A1Y0I3M1_9GAMM|nr:50S ribosomal protein L24 [Oleiphilus messinensis]ARU54789.1 50S ribosomal subunit protein L24 [Oleiphilus messinensis]MCG8610571.1 50S ribosomal protein L24 [Pseudomonadales bacterium]